MMKKGTRTMDAFIQAILTLLALIITMIVIPFLQQKVKTERQQRWLVWAQEAVTAAEQIFGGGTGEQKKKYVTDFLMRHGLSAEDANVLTEAAVSVIATAPLNKKE
jgi:predicted membrane-bound dolichyl-phosphate-mannose-protein mannosyltransferase